MKLASWPCPQPGGGEADELALCFDAERAHRLLILPALFDEANRMRRFTVEVMRRLDGAGIDCVLPDLPGCNESLIALEVCSLSSWVNVISSAISHFRPHRILAIRGGGLVWPEGIGGWHYGAIKGASILRQLLRARVLSAREAGREENADALLEQGMAQGLELAGYRFGPAMIGELLEAKPLSRSDISAIDQDLLSGSPLWLRAEPGEDRAQADALAALIAMGMTS